MFICILLFNNLKMSDLRFSLSAVENFETCEALRGVEL